MSEAPILLRGGLVVTMDGERRVERTNVLVEGDRIAKVGVRRAPKGARVIEAKGCAVIPGLVQGHVHLCQALFRGMADDLPLLAWLKDRIWPLEAAHDRRSLRASARLGLAEMIRAGTTCILDMGTVHHQDAVFEAMADSGIRGFSGKAMMDRGDDVPEGLRERTDESLAEAHRLRAR
jgi:5-methylthioadenosine/S-adenosylhomocysteine deaminase